MLTETTPKASTEPLPMSGAIVGDSGRKLRVCVLHPSAEGTTGPFTEEIDGICTPEYYDPEARYEWTNVFLMKATSTADLTKLTNSGKYDVYLNLCDGAWDEDRAGRDVVEALERLNVPYTGADAAFYEPSKIDMKKAAYFYGIQVPAWVLVMGGPGQEEVGLAEVLAPPERGGLRFPLIVKHPSGYGSVGMTKQSKVNNEEELRQQVSFFVNEYGGALVEEFIAGREFTVLVVEEPRTKHRHHHHHHQQQQQPLRLQEQQHEDEKEEEEDDPQLSDLVPVAYTPVECVFGPDDDFKHFDLKFIDSENMGWQICKHHDLAEKLKAAARETYLATSGVSYGRCDFRVDMETGDIYFLEINPNCGVLLPPEYAGSADYILTLDPDHNHRHFLASILAAAVHRHRCKQPAAVPAFISIGCSGLPAAAAAPPPPAAAADVTSMVTVAVTSPAPSSDVTETNDITTAALPPTVDVEAGAEADPMTIVAPTVPSSTRDQEADAAPPPPLPSAAADDNPQADTAAAANTEAAAARPTPKRQSGCSGRRLGMVAVRPIRAGRLVQRNEHSQFTLASRRWIERKWDVDSRERRMFDEVAYPLNDQIVVMPPTDLTKWNPLTHSCDPNTHLDGLNLVARRDIAKGEVITVDFATLYGPKLVTPFDCTCGSPRCRGRITPQDFLLPYILEEYGDEQVSSFVLEARRHSRSTW